MKALLLNNTMHVNPVDEEESGFKIPDTKLGLASALIDTVKALAASRLQKTDWYLTRFVGVGKEIPASVKAEREAIYAWCDDKEIEIDSLEYGDLLNYDATA